MIAHPVAFDNLPPAFAKKTIARINNSMIASMIATQTIALGKHCTKIIHKSPSPIEIPKAISRLSIAFKASYLS